MSLTNWEDVAFLCLCAFGLWLLGWVGLQTLSLRRRSSKPIEFRETEHDPDQPKDPAKARISQADLRRNSEMRRPVRKYDIDEDGADPFRE